MKHSSVTSDGDLKKLWHWDEFMELVVWQNQNQMVCGFELYYKSGKDQFCLKWNDKDKAKHYLVDQGESKPNKNNSPILKNTEIQIQPKFLAEKLLNHSSGVDSEVLAFILDKIKSI